MCEEAVTVIGKAMVIKGNIVSGQDLYIDGEVQGNVDSATRICIRPGGSLIGDVRTAGITIDDGAYFKGSIDIVNGRGND